MVLGLFYRDFCPSKIINYGMKNEVNCVLTSLILWFKEVLDFFKVFSFS